MGISAQGQIGLTGGGSGTLQAHFRVPRMERPCVLMVEC